MTFTAFFLILTSIVMHSLWHFLSKSSGKPSFAFFSIFSFSLFCSVLPLGLMSGLMLKIPFSLLKYCIAGGLFGTVCDFGLIYAYKYSDISLAYPMARALPVFFTMMATALFGWGSRLSWIAITGMMIIFSGCLLMALSNNHAEMSRQDKMRFIRKGLPGILLAALCTTGYTIVDSFGIKMMMDFAAENNVNNVFAAGAYSCAREIPATISLTLCAAVCRVFGRDRGAFTSLAKSYHPYCAGFFAAGAYFLVLLAMNYVENVSFVQSFRQLSLPFSAFLGWYILKEKITVVRWIALVMIMAGLLICIVK